MISHNKQYVIPGSITASDLDTIYKDEYRKIKQVIKKQPNTKEPTIEDVNNMLSPCDSFSLYDHDKLDFKATFTKLDALDDDLYFDFSGITTKFDLQTLVDTQQVAELNPRQETRAAMEKE